MNLLDALTGKVALYVIGGLTALLVIVGVAWKIQTASLKLQLATSDAKVQNLESAVAGYKVAAQWQADKLATAVATAEKEDRQTKALLADLQSKPMPKTPEEARAWALSALERDRR